jgi:hypothetical protein
MKESAVNRRTKTCPEQPASSTMENSQDIKRVCSVGPADSKGKPHSRYWPGGSRPPVSPCWRQPLLTLNWRFLFVLSVKKAKDSRSQKERFVHQKRRDNPTHVIANSKMRYN